MNYKAIASWFNVIPYRCLYTYDLGKSQQDDIPNQDQVNL